MADMQKILKLKLGTPKRPTLITYEMASENDDRIEATTAIDEPVHPDLIAALDKYLTMATGLAFNDPDWWADGHISGVSLKHSEDGIGAVFSMKLEVDGKVICDNTPYQGPESFDQQELSRLHHEIVQCLNGKRLAEQQVLDFGYSQEPEATLTPLSIPTRSKAPSRSADARATAARYAASPNGEPPSLARRHATAARIKSIMEG